MSLLYRHSPRDLSIRCCQRAVCVSLLLPAHISGRRHILPTDTAVGRGRSERETEGPNVCSLVVPHGQALVYLLTSFAAFPACSEYYFSVENLCNDMFLRQQMNVDGYLPLSFIANFNRVRTLTNDLALIGRALDDSEEVWHGSAPSLPYVLFGS